MRNIVDRNFPRHISLHVAVPCIASDQENRTIDSISDGGSDNGTGSECLLRRSSTIIGHSLRFSWFGLHRSNPEAIRDASEKER